MSLVLARALRISNKGKKPFPKPIFQYGNQDKMIAEFLDNRQFILDFLRMPEKG